jgi:hypothetical protein
MHGSKLITSAARILGSWVLTRLGAGMFFYLLFLQIFTDRDFVTVQSPFQGIL